MHTVNKLVWHVLKLYITVEREHLTIHLSFHKISPKKVYPHK